MRLVLAVQSLEKFPMPLPDPMVLMISGFFLAMLIHAVLPWWPGWWQWCYELALLVEVVIKLFLNAKIVIGKVVWWYWCIRVTCAQHFRVTSLFSFWTCQSGEGYWESWLYVMPDSNLKTLPSMTANNLDFLFNDSFIACHSCFCVCVKVTVCELGCPPTRREY